MHPVSMSARSDAPELVKGKNILLATDGKQHSAKAIKYAIEMAKLTSSKLFIVCVVSPKPDEDRQTLIAEGMKHLNGLKDWALDEGVETTTLLEGGSPYQTLIVTAERIKASSIIVGTSQKSAIDRVLIGSVSEFIVRNAPCSVIIVK